MTWIEVEAFVVTFFSCCVSVDRLWAGEVYEAGAGGEKLYCPVGTPSKKRGFVCEQMVRKQSSVSALLQVL